MMLPPCKRSRQAGQALVLGLILAGLGALALVRYFGVGQAVAEKSRLVHAADTAAYSAALVQARSLNMLAMLNRTQVAHQVAMAHVITLGSWAMLGGTESVRAASGNPPIYLIAMMFGAAHGQAYAAALPALGMDAWSRTGTGQLAQAYARHESLVHDLLQTVQQQVVHSVPDARQAAVAHLLRQQYQDDDTSIQVFDDAWGQAWQIVSGQAWRPLVQQATQPYRFLDVRDHTARNPWMVQARCPTRRHELRRRGRTQLSDAGVWESIDTQSYHALRANRWIGCYYREYDMAWGWIPAAQGQGAQVPYADQVPDNFSLQDFWRWVQGNTPWNLLGGQDNPLANSRAHAARAIWPSRGLPTLIDLQPDSAPIGFRLQLRRTGQDGYQYTALSGAEAYFQRPVSRRDGQRESANLFHPYWQARLSKAVAEGHQAGQP